MAYSAPELSLVGAAQNLVLTDSVADVTKQDIQCNFRFEELDSDDYDAQPLW
jgi:hypothetical protein